MQAISREKTTPSAARPALLVQRAPDAVTQWGIGHEIIAKVVMAGKLVVHLYLDMAEWSRLRPLAKVRLSNFHEI